jgi:hypothetical protein
LEQIRRRSASGICCNSLVLYFILQESWRANAIVGFWWDAWVFGWTILDWETLKLMPPATFEWTTACHVILSLELVDASGTSNRGSCGMEQFRFLSIHVRGGRMEWNGMEWAHSLFATAKVRIMPLTFARYLEVLNCRPRCGTATSQSSTRLDNICMYMAFDL